MSEDVDWGAYVRDTHGKYVTHYLAYAEAHDQPTAADYDALEAEQPNILIAMDCVYREEQWEQVRRFAWAFCQPVDGFMSVRGYWGELHARLEQAKHAAEAEAHQYDAAAFAQHLATLLYQIGDLKTARREFQRVLAIFEELDERESVGVICHQLGVLAHATGEHAEAQCLYQKSLDIAKALGNQKDIARTLHQLALLAQDTGDYAEAQRLYQRSMEINKNVGNQAGIASTLHNLGMVIQTMGKYVETQRLYQHSLKINKELLTFVFS